MSILLDAVAVFCLIVTDFQFPSSVCFYTMPDRSELPTSESSIGNCRQSSQDTATVNELRIPMHSRDHDDSENVSYVQ